MGLKSFLFGKFWSFSFYYQSMHKLGLFTGLAYPAVCICEILQLLYNWKKSLLDQYLTTRWAIQKTTNRSYHKTVFYSQNVLDLRGVLGAKKGLEKMEFRAKLKVWWSVFRKAQIICSVFHPRQTISGLDLNKGQKSSADLRVEEGSVSSGGFRGARGGMAPGPALLLEKRGPHLS